MAGSIEEWLAGIAQERFAPVFTDNEVDLDAIALLNEQDLEKLGIPLGPRRAHPRTKECMLSACSQRPR